MTARIHIVGSSPRTGTTLMNELVVNCFRIDGHGRHEMSIFRWPDGNPGVFCSKAPRDIMVVGPLLRINRGLHVIHMVRDPRDVIVSKHAKDPRRYWSNLGMFLVRRPAARRLSGHPRFTTVRYEDLVTDPDAVQDALAARMPFLESVAPFSSFHRTAAPDRASLDALGGVRPIDTSRIGLWREHKPRVAAQIALHGSIDDDLIELGYETDSSWREELEGVEPDNGESHWPESHGYRQRSLRQTIENYRQILKYAARQVARKVRSR